MNYLPLDNIVAPTLIPPETMQRGQNIRPVLRLYLAIFFSYFLVKFLLKPFVLEKGFGGLAETFVFSYPNFCEAVTGTIFLTLFLLTINEWRIQRKAIRVISAKSLYLVATLLAGVYVILQEFKVHNLGGKNVYDPYDVVFSILGLMVGYGILVWIKPVMGSNVTSENEW